MSDTATHSEYRMPENPNDPMNDRVPTPGPERNFRKIGIIAISLFAMFVAAILITSTTTDILHRPGVDPGSTEKAPAD